MIVRRIRVEETGCRKLRIAPNLGDLSYAKGSFPTPYGVVSVSHTKEEDGDEDSITHEVDTTHQR